MRPLKEKFGLQPAECAVTPHPSPEQAELVLCELCCCALK